MRFADAAASCQGFLLLFADSLKIARNPSLEKHAFSRRFRVLIYFFQQYPCRISRVSAGSLNRPFADTLFSRRKRGFFRGLFTDRFWAVRIYSLTRSCSAWERVNAKRKEPAGGYCPSSAVRLLKDT
jgi:hypothetical protein